MANYTIEVNFKQDKQSAESNGNFSIPNIADGVVYNQFDVLGKATEMFAGIGIVKQVAEVASEIFQWHISKIGREKGSRDAQDKANAIMSIYNGLKNPLQFALNRFFEREQSLYEHEMERIHLTLLRERGGPSLNRSRREE